MRDDLPRVSVPVLVMTGSEDRITRAAESAEIANLLPNATLEIVEDAGHFPFVEQPSRYFEALGSWLARV